MTEKHLKNLLELARKKELLLSNELSNLHDRRHAAARETSKAKAALVEYQNVFMTFEQSRAALAEGKFVTRAHPNWDRVMLIQVDNIKFPGGKNRSIIFKITDNGNGNRDITEYEEHDSKSKDWILVNEGKMIQ